MSEVETPLGTLRCTLRAAKEVNSRFGSFTEAFRRLGTFDFDAYVQVVAAGLGKSPKEVEADVYGHGLPDLVRPLTDYLTLLSNGGRAPDAVKDDKSGNG